MSARRLVGLETEYGIIRPSMPKANSTVLSAQIVDAYAQLVAEQDSAAKAARWDYTDESPLQDARGFAMDRDQAHPSQLTDVEPGLEDEEGIWTAESIALDGNDAHVGSTLYQEKDSTDVVMNMVLGNGARLYVDHAHPEYSSPESMTPRDAVLWDQAGDEVMRRAAATAQRLGSGELLLYKNNTDNKSVSYGSHENYLMPRDVEFSSIASGLTPFFASRQIFCGAGRVGQGMLNERASFQISQRADFFEAEVGLETTVNRPIINTRDEPHANWDKYRRLHVIIGDANLGQISTLLRVGTTNLVLSLIEAGMAPRLELEEPVVALQQISHDPTLKTKVRLRGGVQLSAIEIQRHYLQAAENYCADRGIDDPDTTEILNRWAEILDMLERDPMEAADQVDWIAKYKLITSFTARHQLSLADPRVAMMDLQWADLRTDKGLYYRMAERGAIQGLFSQEQINQAVANPPEDTRAYLRGMTLQRYAPFVVAANWDALSFAVPGARKISRFHMPEPLRGTRNQIGELFEAQLEIAEFIDELARRR
ncbi:MULTISPECIES: depupylase/deamidase Dop [Glutamicibacter]|uniref:Proteasome component n=1 Tax=Glutamicibacter arilaitensis (strain DSM 16368 / CIP 108037 / IAM 15318 / JCM 13566 / NCIMB 14258 / Re117) TaxID=861360 RepID=A0ABP1U510_GLUAR|nr:MULTISPECIES: depupylase/deamidase Dop [Glutamicibacter]CBT75851.1 putative proteasome component [Glutamicibacter arilaitensis Re117]HCH48045.1 proteasome accessory factor PafA2 [Glutamicibacter sp.]